MSANSAAALKPSFKFSSTARTRLRLREREVYKYYDDMGPGRGNCTWGAGILAHRGPSTQEELNTPVTPAAVDAEFASRVTEAEQTVRNAITHQPLTQDQYDALVSYTYNLGQRGASKALELIDDGDFDGAVAEMKSMIRVKVKTGVKPVIAHGLVTRRAEESAPFRK
ncbi:glycoside hydrolase family protein [Pseudoduganella ginsengisoli]|uniref:Lysozyme n=1 Tax=Pseudoduganella ginsengisoli TaxID=1462440 RepID=A0A6L6PTV8_9BURK|nr:glycoside hydrolase family protein [Pseudoduganella ginsengisoli]MTW00661.1 glycoside hydrolase family protein [Pseudoduganella ginsengisoli]